MGIRVPTPEEESTPTGYGCETFSAGTMPNLVCSISGVKPGSAYWADYLPNGLWLCKPYANCSWKGSKKIGPDLFETICYLNWFGTCFYCVIFFEIDNKILYLSGGISGTNFGVGGNYGQFQYGTHQVIAPYYPNTRSISLLSDQLGIEANRPTYAEPGGLSVAQDTETIRIARQWDGTCVKIKR